MQKMKSIVRSCSERIQADFGCGPAYEALILPLFRRSLEKAQEFNQRYLVSTYDGGSIAVVTTVKNRKVNQRCYYASELSGEDKKVVKTNPIHAGQWTHVANVGSGFGLRIAEGQNRSTGTPPSEL